MSVAAKTGNKPEREKPALDRVGTGSLQFSVSHSWEELEQFRDGWERILQAGSNTTIFSSIEWLGAWWKAFGREKELLALLFSNSSGEPVGIVPLYRDVLELARHLGCRLRRLRLVGDGSGDSDNLDLLVRPGYEDICVRTWLEYLPKLSRWDICELNTLPAHSLAAARLLYYLKARGWIYVVKHWSCSAILLPDTWPSYLNQLLSEDRYNLSRYLRRLTRRYQVRFYKCTEQSQLSPSLEALFRLHQARWQRRGGAGTFASAERRQFYYEMARLFLARRWLEFWLLGLNGQVVAAQFGFRYGDTAYSLQEGFDPEYFSDRVGFLLRGHVLRELIAEGVRRYDFLGGVDCYKERWGAQPGTYLGIHFARPFTRGSVYLRAMRDGGMAKEWLRRNLPKPVFAILRQIYRSLRGHETPTNAARSRT